MQPNQPNDDRSLAVPSRDDAAARTPDREAAARLMRDQIDQIYNHPSSGGGTAPVNQPPAQSPAPSHHINSHDWQHYHSAWQQYYQQYYERYYLQQLNSSRKSSPQPNTSSKSQDADKNPAFPLTEKTETEQSASRQDTAVHEIRNELLDKIKTGSTKARSSKHFWPIMSAVAVMLMFLLLQYNRVMISQVKAYVSPGAISPQNIIIDPTSDIKVGPEPRLIIPKINVDAPVVYGVQSLADAPVQVALKKGVVHYPIPGANSLPGEKGNTVILGHSSNDVFDDGDYKFVFVQLEQMQKGDTFYIHHEGTRYTYSVTEKEVILPNQVSKLILPKDKPMASLVTCVPLGTALKRLVVYAEQISPDPAVADESSEPTTSDEVSAPVLPGNSPTLFDRLFGS